MIVGPSFEDASGGAWERYVPEKAERIPRSAPERDADRILYSTAFRRLDGITQVAAAGEVALFHNRLTHSLKVGQVGRKIAASINYQARLDHKVRRACFQYSGLPFNEKAEEAIDPWILEAAGMAHDLGHPPFGHIAEAVLQKVLGKTPNDHETLKVPEGFSLNDSFEGNAQSFRIVTRLAFGRLSLNQQNKAEGLNLTRATLSAILKYPWLCNQRPNGVDALKLKWGAYDSEAAILSWSQQGVSHEQRLRPDGLPEWRSITAQAMDWADDITYAVHDVEDFCRAKLIPAEILSKSDPNSALVAGFWDYCAHHLRGNTLIAEKLGLDKSSTDQRLLKIFNEVRRRLPEASQATRSERESFRRWSSERIDAFTDPGPDGIFLNSKTGFLDVALESLVEVEILKKLTWYFVINRPALGSAQRGQAKIIRELFVWLSEWSQGEYQGPQWDSPSVARTEYNLNGLPPRLIDYLDVTYWQTPPDGGYKTASERIARAVVDYIASLTERQAVELHSRLAGVTTASMLDSWFQV
ncbi:hypothetical protein BMF89_16560 [Arthrobacter sp. SRS-W-1-2016]|uniref:deoxyguanosinetriphosphate triphosphohydrolase family protein n=1 Tax=Arthrobacter sp. SRS-W-1-2016 TaxID=1930254 RepID=UPI0009912846|nr:dNTP triphosphohydrolase [Arthrobacter sp. SRS-W-1-2016]OOP60481.1 hypothetical protein BMF89_16560 [Arthrobacter sp. SRS-W-1-2016]